MKAKLLRGWRIDNSGVFGELFFDEKRFCLTKELLWRCNKKNISCIPDGIYSCVVSNSNSFGKTVHINNVPNRTDVLVHWGSWLSNTNGCILVGNKISVQEVADFEIMLQNTRTTHKKLMKYLNDYNVQKFRLEIWSPWGFAL